MGYMEALVGLTKRKQGKALEKQAAKKSLWGSVGRTLGGLGAMAITGGMVNPLTVGLITSAATFLGGAIGAKKAGGLKGGTFYQDEKGELQSELGAFGSENIKESLMAGVKAGGTQKMKLMKDARAAKIADPGISDEALGEIRKGTSFKEGFKESTLGRGWEKHVTKPAESRKLGRKLVAEGEAADIRSKYTDVIRGEAGMSDSAIDYQPLENIGGDYQDPSSIPFERGDFYGKSGKKPLSSSISTMPGRSTSGELGVSPYDEFGSWTGGAHYETPVDVARAKSKKFYSENVFGVGDKAGEVIPISEAIPQALQYSDGATSKQSLLGKVGGFISDTVEERELEASIAKVRGTTSAITPKETWQEKLGLGTGYEFGGRPTSWTGDTKFQRELSERYKTYRDTKMPGIPEWRIE